MPIDDVIGVEQVPVYETVIEAPAREVVDELLAAEPDAVVLIPQAEEKNIAENNIRIQDPGALNTVLMAVDFGYENTFYFVSPKYSWLQSYAMLGLNAYYLQKFSMKLGQWSRVMQMGGRAFANGLTKLGFIRQEIWQKRAEKVGNFLTHGAMMYAFYALLQMMSELPNLHEGFFSGHAQVNALLKTGSALVSGLGWTMLSRKWDALPENERPVSKRAHSTFSNVRGLVLGIFVPLLVSTPNNATLTEFLSRNTPFYISAAVGMVLYIWGDKILARYPQIARALTRYDNFISRINDKMVSWRDQAVGAYYQMKDKCSALLRPVVAK